MASYTAVADVSRTLLELLRDEIEDRSDVLNVAPDQVVLGTPAEATSDADVRLSLYLYRVEENPAMNNRIQQEVADGERSDPPLTLDLYYLLTAYPAGGSGDVTARTSDQQRVLGLATQVLYDNATVQGERAAGSLGDDARLAISLESESLDELTTLWTAVTDDPYQPSTSYHVSPVEIDSREVESFERVGETDTRVSRRSEES